MPFHLKAKQITSLGTQSKAFSKSTNIKSNLFFWFWIFHKSPQDKHSISSPSPYHKPILHFINIYHLTQMPIQNLLMQFESTFEQLYSPISVWIKGIPVKTGTNELIIHSSGNLSLNKVLNMFVKDFKHLSPSALNISRATPKDLLSKLSFDSLHTTLLL